MLAIGKLANADARFRIDDPVQVRRQDGSVVRIAITGIPMGMMKFGMAEVLLRGIDKSDILPGDEVWLEDASEQSVALDRAGMTVFRDIKLLAAGPQVNAVVRRAEGRLWTSRCVDLMIGTNPTPFLAFPPLLSFLFGHRRLPKRERHPG